MKKLAFLFLIIALGASYAFAQGNYVPETIEFTHDIEGTDERVYFELKKTGETVSTVTYDIIYTGYYRTPPEGVEYRYEVPYIQTPYRVTLPINSPKPYFEFDFSLIFKHETRHYKARCFDIPLPGPAFLGHN
ncbi:hypothetical protein FUAX_52920 (plasmid) [Fulvitalea axinellae]|uniref:Uncharacterized protein n=1 Tax=Fulvitalea axinellae TaxID=1182444 RepID=A0AAU9CUX3_9BACT|nr:hypothetical protein FUAX_52920 [Fulvitalea axinellae]